MMISVSVQDTFSPGRLSSSDFYLKLPICEVQVGLECKLAFNLHQIKPVDTKDLFVMQPPFLGPNIHIRLNNKNI